ncbi:MAG: porin [Rhodanobacter sp.]|nr:MAG: porin [Rhodanobacter sp.]
MHHQHTAVAAMGRQVMVRLSAVRHAALALAVAVALGAWMPAYAQGRQSTVEQLKAMVQQQAAEISQLQKRVTELESRATPAHAAAAQPAASRSAIDRLQTDVTQLKAAQASQAGSSIRWKSNGIGFSSPDGRNTMNLTGRIQYDVSNTDGSNDDALNIHGTEVRRLRLGVDGTFDEWLGYRMQFDIANNKVAVRYAYLNVATKVGGNELAIFAGNKKNDRGLDGTTSTNNLWFMEANTVSNAIIPAQGSYGLGLSTALYGASHNWHASLSVTDGTMSQSSGQSGNPTYAVRAHWNPYLTKTAMVHLGAWGFHENFDRANQQVFDSVNIATHFAGVKVRGPQIPNADSSSGYGFEVAGFAGPVAVAGEYGRRIIQQRQGAGGSSTDYDAWSASLSWFLTGETTPYSSKTGVWGRPRIHSAVGDGGMGAFELVARYDKLDLNNSLLFVGGTGHGATLGLNWYLNEHSRLMFDWIHWTTDNPTGSFTGRDSGNTVGARAQVTF